MLRLPLDAKVVEATRNGNWFLPNARSDSVQTLQILLTSLPVPSAVHTPDLFLWRSPSGNYFKDFSSKGTWDQLRVASPRVQWSHQVWFKEGIPRASFILWLAILKRLPTRDRLISWGMNVPPNCPLCSRDQESHDHLFLSCPYSDGLWQAFTARIYGRRSPSLMAAILDSMAIPPVSSSRQASAIMKLLLQVTVYALWRERNSRIFKATSSPLHALKGVVDRTVRDRLLPFPALDSSPSLLESYFGFVSHPL